MFSGLTRSYRFFQQGFVFFFFNKSFKGHDEEEGSNRRFAYHFFVFPRNCRVLGVHEMRKEEKGKGEGGRGEEEEREGLVFLTFRMVIGRATSDRTSAWKSHFVHDIASQRYVFLLKNSTFHLHMTLFLES